MYHNRKILLALPHGVTVEHWEGQTYWTWVVAHAYCAPAREVRAYKTKASALRAGRTLSATLSKKA
jgi:hypothetical protein